MHAALSRSLALVVVAWSIRDMAKAKFTLMTKLRASVPGEAVHEGFVIDVRWSEKAGCWIYKLSLEDGGEDWDNWFSEPHLEPI